MSDAEQSEPVNGIEAGLQGGMVDQPEAEPAEFMPPPEDKDLLMACAYAEKITGFKREQRIVGGNWIWTGKLKDGTEVVHTIEQMPGVRGCGADLLAHLHQFCEAATLLEKPPGAELLWQCMRGRRVQHGGELRAHFRIAIAESNPGEMPRTIAAAEADDLGMAVAHALCIAMATDFEALHRELFPHRYLLTSE